MYQILCDDYVIHDPRIDDLQVFNAKCELEVNKTGALSFQILSLHPYYNIFHEHTSEITLLQDEEVLFRGRVLNIDVTFEKIKTIECEGALAYLLDSIQRPKKYTIDDGENTIKLCLESLINIHNSQVDDFKKFKVGNVTMVYDYNNDDEEDNNGNVKLNTNYDTTLSFINNNLIGNFGGYVTVRYDGNDNYIDYIDNYTNICDQTIQFGENIIDMTTNLKGENIYTAIVPSGNPNFEGVLPSLTRYSDGTYDGIVKNGDYAYNPTAVNQYGWIWRHMHYNTSSSKRMLDYTIADLKNCIDVEFTLELTALDLHLINKSVDKINVGNFIQCISEPHNINTLMLVKSMTINVDDPSKTNIKLALPSQAQYIAPGNLTDSVNKNKKQTEKNINESNDNFKQLLSNSNDELKNWVSDNFTPLTSSDGGTVDLSDYAKNADVDTKLNDLKDWTDNNYVPRNSVSDLSLYAKIADVNTAFDELATALGGL